MEGDPEHAIVPAAGEQHVAQLGGPDGAVVAPVPAPAVVAPGVAHAHQPDPLQVPHVEHAVCVARPQPHGAELVLVNLHVAAAAAGAHEEALLPAAEQLRPHL